MGKELTEKDIELMRQELYHRRFELRPKLIEAVKEARAFGDLSENFEYKAAKQEKNRNDSRCRYLENVIRTATIISDKSQEGTVGLYDKVTLYVEDDEEEMVIQIVTTMRQDALKGLVSKESPVGRAVLGRRVGDRVTVQVNDNYGYDVIIRAIEPGEDNGEAPWCPSNWIERKKNHEEDENATCCGAGRGPVPEPGRLLRPQGRRDHHPAHRPAHPGGVPG